MATTSFCNNNCICVDFDCMYLHLFDDIKKRKMIRKIYDFKIITNKDEPNMEIRKKNCKFGQVCLKEDCGFRHRLCYSERKKLSKLVEEGNKMPEKTIEKKQTTIIVHQLPMKNLFESLETTETTVEEIVEQPKVVEVINVPNDEITWAKVCKEGKKKVEIDITPKFFCWADICDD